MISEQTDKIRVLGVFPALLPTAIIYIIKPFSELVKTGKYAFEYALGPYVKPEQIRWSDVVLFSRNIEPEYRWVLDEVIAQGKPCTYDLDDYLWEVPVSAQFGVDLFSPRRVAQMEQYLRHVDMVRVFNQRLLEKSREYNPDCYMALPCIDMHLTPREKPARKDDRVNITYVTGRGSQDALLSIVSDAIENILERYPDKAHFTFWGEIPPQFQGHSNVDVVPIQYNYDLFLKDLSSGKYDIGLAPLLPTHFYLSKTNTKFRDYGASNIAGIYSNVDIYAGCVEDGKNGLIAENEPGAWFDAMARLIEDKTLRQSIQRQAYQDVYNTYRQELAEQEWETILTGLLKKGQAGARSHARFWSGASLAPQWGLCLGAAAQVPPNFIRVSPAWEPGVSVIADLNAPLPFAEHTFSAVMANHALGKVGSLSQVMTDLFRVSKDRAQVTILEPYTSPSRVEAQRLSGIVFNEDTPRRWTNCATSPLFEMEYIDRGASAWGIGSGQDMDFRCVRMEFFYTDEYLPLRNEERRTARRTKDGVCDQIFYRLIAAKTPLNDLMTKQVAKQMDYLEPAEVTIRRLEDNRKLIFADYDRKSKELTALQKANGLEQVNVLNQQIQALEQKQSSEQRKADEVKNEYEKQLEKYRQEMGSLQQYLDFISRAGRQSATELGVMRSRKIFQVIRNLFDRADLRDTVGAAYKQMLDDSLLFNQDINGYLLQPSEELQMVRSFSYQFTPGKPGLKRVSLLPVIDVPPGQGIIGIELGPVNAKIAAQVTVPANKLSHTVPVHFDFPPIQESSQSAFEMRVFVYDVDAPVRLYEWRQYRLRGLRGVLRQPFLSLEFA